MRIAHVSDVYLPALGGIEMHVADLAQRQADRGDDVSVLTFNAKTRDRVDSADSERGVTVTRVPSLAQGTALDLSGFDAVHAHVSSVSPLASTLASLASRRGIPTVATVHSLWQGLGPLPAASAAVFGLRSSPVAWTAVSGIAAEGVERWLPPGRRVDVLPNAADVAPRAETPLRSCGDPVTIVSTMRLARLKRPLPLMRMFARVSGLAGTPVRLTLIGDGGQRRAVEIAVRACGLVDSVRLTGRLDRESVLALVAQSDVYVAPAPLESFGLAALEARCVGLPVVAMAASGVRDFVRHAENGFLANSDADMVRLLVHLADDPTARYRIAEHNRATPSEFGWSDSLERTDRAYERAGVIVGAIPGSRRRARAASPVRRAR